ncbi:MAG: hypothetical protein H8E34_11200 [Bacteroidetes bacterium]|nr:hypothetical protein [Bacteroidota bacterium]MBL6943820.1 hypothetical protein [Bacteroidales bacterium]
MKTKITPFIKGFSYYSIAIFLLSFAIHQWIPIIEISNSWPFIIAFMYAFTLFAFATLAKYIDSKLTFFANAFMLINFGKLFLFSIIIIVYAWLNHNDAISFTITFFVYYLLLTTYEIVALLKMQKSNG